MYEKATTREELARNFQLIEERIEKACLSAGRARSEVRLLPVSKTVDEEKIRWAAELGYRSFGENKVQELQEKSQLMADLNLHWAAIGHLQTNKVKNVAQFAHEFQALDSLEIAIQLNKRLEQQQRTLNVLVQINTSFEPQKYGLAPEKAAAFLDALAEFKFLRIKGLMTLALLSKEDARVRDCFILLRETRDSLLTNLPDGMSLDDLSMGMSGDFEIAIAEGATTIRIGQALFGSRVYPDSYYWG